MKKTCLMAMAAGLACCALASAKPPTKPEIYTGEIREAKPVTIQKVKRLADGRIVADGPLMPYTEVTTRNPQISCLAWDCFGMPPGTSPNAPGYGTQCDMNCPNPCNTTIFTDNGCRWWFGTSYANPNTADNMEELNCPPGAVVDGIDMTWTQSAGAPATNIYHVFFHFQEVLDGNCTVPSTATGTGISLGYATPAGAWYSHAGGLSGIGMVTPSTNINGATGFASGSYQWIMASSVTSTGITLFGAPCSQFLWGTGDATGEPWRPGLHNPIAFDDDNPTDGAFDPLLECYDYTGFVPCPSLVGKMAAFRYLRCAADYNNDGFPDGIDYDQFNAAFENLDPTLQRYADLNGDCFVDGIDYDYFNAEFESACP